MSADRATCAAMDLQAIEHSFEHNKRVSEQYADAKVLQYVYHLIPKDIRDKRGRDQVLALLSWFKNDFMRWLPNQITCTKCADGQKVMRPTIHPGSTWQLRKIESYKCENCGSEQVYPRYSDVKSIAETRLGRCGEWSILFGAVLNSVSIKGRIVHDYLDHCWNEALVDGQWVHLDSTLQLPTSLGHPYHYEQNWGKKYTYVLAFEPNKLEDVTRRYTEHWDEILGRRLQILKKELETSSAIDPWNQEDNFQRLYSNIQ